MARGHDPEFHDPKLDSVEFHDPEFRNLELKKGSNDCDKDLLATAELQTLLRSSGTAARSESVNRTHRVVRERAKTVAARRSKVRSLWIPLLIFSSLLVGVCVAVWTVLDEYEIAATGSQVASYQVVVPLLWSIPVSAALLAVVWFRQSRTDIRKGPME